MSIDILLITPPFTQPNTPYPASPFLKGFLKTRGYSAEQIDLAIETFTYLFSEAGLSLIFKEANPSCAESHVFNFREEYLSWIDPVTAFLRGEDNTLAHLICSGQLPEGPRFSQVPDLDWYFGNMGITDRAKYLATMFMEDISDFITAYVDSDFGFSRYAESLGLSAISFDSINAKLNNNTCVTDIMCRIFDNAVKELNPAIAAFTVPFPGNLFGALKCAVYLKQNYPDIITVMGGGYVNTELRNIAVKEFFDLIDYLCLDDGEVPLEQIIKVVCRGESEDSLVRTMHCNNGDIIFSDNETIAGIPHDELPPPDYTGLPLNKYISVLETANPMHRLWSDGKWNKLMLAHGCYWHKCAFCDTSLDYIARYSPAPAEVIADRIEAVIEQTGIRGFHFVDEAAPPKLLGQLSTELLRRKLRITWWTNIRFEKSYTPELCELMASAGCIAVAGGLEVASERLLKLINKGVTLAQVAQACDALTDAGIMVHAYLMYGFPTQSEQETVDSLEVVRQLFEQGLVHSGYWHRFCMTVHSPVGKDPAAFHVKSLRQESTFAENDVPHKDPKGCNHEKFSNGLKKALLNYMHAQCFEFDLQEWFDFKIPKTTVKKNFISRILKGS